MAAVVSLAGCSDEADEEGYDSQDEFDDIELESDILTDTYVDWVSPSPVFSASFSSNQLDHVEALALDSNGRLILGGYSWGAIDFGGGPLVGDDESDLGIVVAALDSSGQHLWSRRFDIARGQIEGLATGPSGQIFITGPFGDSLEIEDERLETAGEKDTFVVRLNTMGEATWVARYGVDGYTMGQAVAVDSQDNHAIVGHINGVADFGGQLLESVQWDVFVAFYDETGAHQWSFLLDGDGEEYVESLTFDSSDELLIVGRYSGSLAIASHTHVCTVGDCLFLTKLDSDGRPRWSLGFDTQTIHAAVTTDAQGNIILAGSIGWPVDFGGGTLTPAGYTDVIVVKFDPDGQHLFSRVFGNDWGWQQASAVGADNSGLIHLTGGFTGTIDFGGDVLESTGDYPYLEHSDVFMTTLDPQGNHVWSARFGDSDLTIADTEYGTALAVGVDRVAYAGNFVGTIDFDQHELTSGTDDQDIFVVSFGDP